MSWVGQAARSMVDSLDDASDGVVLAAAAVDASGRVTYTNPADLGADRRFEIGSVTKTMTATVLALLVGEGRLRLEDEISRWLSAGPHGAITVGQLATHTSGLPSVAPNFRTRQSDPANPWAGYTFDLAQEGLRRIPARPGAGTRSYSNLGYQLLALILERVSGQDYATLISERLLDPLGMTHSGVGRRGAGTALPGHAMGREVHQWAQPWGAGGVEASIEDLARYAQACLFPPATPLGEAIALAQTPVVRIHGSRAFRSRASSGAVDGDAEVAQVSGVAEQALAWTVRAGGVREHSGGTGGFSACVSVDQPRGRAVAVLVSNQGSPAYSAHLKRTAHAVLAGEDPTRVRAPQVYPAWRDKVLEAGRALVEGDVARVFAGFAPRMREKFTAEQLERAWRNRTQNSGPAGEVTVARHEAAASGAVVVEVAIAFAAGTQSLRMAVTPTGEIGGLQFLPTPGDADT